MRILSIRKQWKTPNRYGDNRFEIEYEDRGEVYYTAFIAVDEIQAYQMAMRSLSETTNGKEI